MAAAAPVHRGAAEHPEPRVLERVVVEPDHLARVELLGVGLEVDPAALHEGDAVALRRQPARDGDAGRTGADHAGVEGARRRAPRSAPPASTSIEAEQLEVPGGQHPAVDDVVAAVAADLGLDRRQEPGPARRRRRRGRRAAGREAKPSGRGRNGDWAWKQPAGLGRPPSVRGGMGASQGEGFWYRVHRAIPASAKSRGSR